MNFSRFCLFAFLILCSCSRTQSIAPQAKESMIELLQIEEQNRWWQSFKDPLMDVMAKDLITQNLDIKIAKLRISEARAVARSANSGFFPEISASANGSRGNKQSGFNKPKSINQGGFDVAWEIDVFGQTQALINSAEHRVESSIASAEDITNYVIAELIRSIIEFRQAQETVKKTTELLSIQDEQIKLISSRVKAGLIDSTLLSISQAERFQTAALLPIAQAALGTAQYKIERLLGKKSGELSEILNNTKGEVTAPEANNILNISLDSIRFRPDIRASRADLLAAQADLAKAEADVWPRVSISGFFGVQDGSAAVGNNPIWSLASAITAPLLNFGKLRGAIDASGALANKAALSYQNTSLIALQETKTALSDYLNGINALSQQLRVINHLKETVSFATERFKNGLTDMTDVTNAQSQLNQATLLYIQQKANVAIDYVRLHKALGTSVHMNGLNMSNF